MFSEPVHYEEPVQIAATVPELNPKRSLASPVEQDEDPFSQSYPSFTRRHKKPPSSLFRRLVKILSSDQIIQSRESRLDREHVQLTSRSNKDGRRSRRESIRSGSRHSQSFLISARSYRWVWPRPVVDH